MVFMMGRLVSLLSLRSMVLRLWDESCPELEINLEIRNRIVVSRKCSRDCKIGVYMNVRIGKLRHCVTKTGFHSNYIHHHCLFIVRLP